MSSSHTPYIAAAATTVGVLGTAYIAYKVYSTQKPARKPEILPETWTKVGKLSDMYIYPIKSCGPVICKTAETSVLGLRQGWCRDRTLMVIDNKNNFLNARGYPELLRVEVSFKGSVLTLKHPDMEECSVNLAEVKELVEPIQAKLWGLSLKVLECGFESYEWFSRLLDRSSTSFRLVYWPTDETRKIRGSTTDNADKFTEDDPGAFPDETSFNIINESSIDDLNTRIQDKVTHRNFRPNLVVKGAKPYDEDNWKYIKIGQTIFRCLKPCTRCIMTTMDPETGLRTVSNEPLKTLRSYRQVDDPEMRRALGSSPKMGLQIGLRAGAGHTLSLNDDVYVAY